MTVVLGPAGARCLRPAGCALVRKLLKTTGRGDMSFKTCRDTAVAATDSGAASEQLRQMCGAGGKGK